jgi:hypothetical protein
MVALLNQGTEGILTSPQYNGPGIILLLYQGKEGRWDEQEEVHGGADRFDAA